MVSPGIAITIGAALFVAAMIYLNVVLAEKRGDHLPAHRAPRGRLTVEDIRARIAAQPIPESAASMTLAKAHQLMQLYRESSIEDCLPKRYAFDYLVAAGRIRRDSGRLVRS